MVLRDVKVAGVGLMVPEEAGKIPGFRARDHIADRKTIKLMTRAVQVGVAGVKCALDATDGWEQTPPGRRGLYIGARPQLGDPEDLSLALRRARNGEGELDLAAFGTLGMDLIHPLWLVRGLSNNVLGFASAAHDFQGTNSNYCDGERGGWTAIQEGARAVAEGRADLVVAGAADSLIGMEALLGPARLASEAAGFVCFRRAPGARLELPSLSDLEGTEAAFGEIGVARWPVAWCGQLVN